MKRGSLVMVGLNVPFYWIDYRTESKLNKLILYFPFVNYLLDYFYVDLNLMS